MLIGSLFPEIHVETTEGEFSLHKWLGESWGIVFSHPADFTPVCTTELGMASALKDEFSKRNVKIIGLSIDSVSSHHEWAKDITSFSKTNELGYPIIAATEEIAQTLGLHEVHPDKNPPFLTVRGVFVINPKKQLMASILYPAKTGRNFDEILRLIDSLQLCTKDNYCATPVNWKVGDEVIVEPSVKHEDALKHFNNKVKVIDLPSKKQYLRYATVD